MSIDLQSVTAESTAILDAIAERLSLPFTQSGSGATERTTLAKLREYVSVADFGATGNGTTDDTAALNLAFAQTNAVVHVPAGTYKVTANLTSPTCNAIIGAGRETTIFKPTAAVTRFLMLGTLSTKRLENFKIDGILTTSATALKLGDDTLPDGPGGGWWMGAIRSLEIRDFHGAGAVGLWYADALNGVIDDVLLEKNYVNLLAQTILGQFPTHTVFNRCSFREADTKGVILRTGYSLAFTGCLFESNMEEGLVIDPDNSPVVGDVIDTVLDGGCWFENNYRPANTSEYQMRVACNVRTARLAIGAVYFSGGVSQTKAMIFTGLYVRATLAAPIVFNAANQIKVSNSGTVFFTSWNRNITFDTVVDFTGVDIAAIRYGQIQFPATTEASSDPNTLDDYEEGTFTPVVALGGGSVTYTTQTGRYTKVGRLVTVELHVTIAAVTTPSGTLTITGMPFTSANISKGAAAVIANNLETTATAAMVGWVNANATTIALFRPSAGAIVSPGADLKAGSVIQVSATYSV